VPAELLRARAGPAAPAAAPDPGWAADLWIGWGAVLVSQPVRPKRPERASRPARSR